MRARQPEMASQTETRWYKLEWPVAVAVALGCANSLAQGAASLAKPYQRDYVEGIILAAAAGLTRGEPLYPLPSPSEPVYIFNPYGPLSYYSVALLLKGFGVSFTFPRLLVLLSGILVAALLAGLLRHWTGSWRVGPAAGALFLALPIASAWLPALRVDLPGLALSLTGLALFARFPERWYASVPFFVAALLVKYSLVAAPGACLVFLLQQRNWRTALWFAGTMAALPVLAFTVLNHATGGGFAFHMVGGHASPFGLSRILVNVAPFWLIHVPLLLLAFPLVAQRPRPPGALLALIYFGLTSLASLAVGRAGFDLNHLLEWSAALCLCAGLGYHEHMRSGGATVRTLALAGLTVLLASLIWLSWHPVERWTECRQAYAYVQDHPGKRLLSENVGALVLAGKPVVLNDPFAYTLLVKNKGWPEAPLNESVRAREFDAIVVSGDLAYLRRKAPETLSSDSRWSPAFVETLAENYRPTRRFLCDDAAVVFEPAANP